MKLKHLGTQSSKYLIQIYQALEFFQSFKSYLKHQDSKDSTYIFS